MCGWSMAMRLRPMRLKLHIICLSFVCWRCIDARLQTAVAHLWRLLGLKSYTWSHACTRTRTLHTKQQSSMRHRKSQSFFGPSTNIIANEWENKDDTKLYGRAAARIVVHNTSMIRSFAKNCSSAELLTKQQSAHAVHNLRGVKSVCIDFENHR